MTDLSGFRQYVEQDQAAKDRQPTIVGTLGDELGIEPETISKFHSTGSPIFLSDVKLGDGTYHSLLPFKLLNIDPKAGTATLQIDDTFSPNLNDKVLRKTDNGMMKVPGWDRESKSIPFVVPLDQSVKDETGNTTTLNQILGKGWEPAMQQAAGGMGGPPML